MVGTEQYFPFFPKNFFEATYLHKCNCEKSNFQDVGSQIIPCLMQTQPTRKTSDTDVVKKPSLYWCEAVPSKSGGRRLKTVSAQTDQTRVSSHPDGSSAVGFTIHTGCRRRNCCIEEVSVRGVPQKLLKKNKDFTLLQTMFTAFTEILQQYQNFLWEVGRGQGGGVDMCVKVGVFLMNSQTDGLKIWGFKTTLMIVKEKDHVIFLLF